MQAQYVTRECFSDILRYWLLRRWQRLEYKMCTHLQSGAQQQRQAVLQLPEQQQLHLRLPLRSAAWQDSQESSWGCPKR